MKKYETDGFDNYCKLIKRKIKEISEDEIETANLFEKLIKKYNLKSIKRVSLPVQKNCCFSCRSSANYFYNYYYKKKEPVIITNLNHKIGNCVKYFDNKNIVKYIGDTKVSIHVSNSKFLNNVNKNFRYTLSSLTNFILLIGKENKKKKVNNNFSINCKQDRKKIYITFNNDKEVYQKKNLAKHEDSISNCQEGKNNKLKYQEECFENYLVDNKTLIQNDGNEIILDNSSISNDAAETNGKILPYHVKDGNHKRVKCANGKDNNSRDSNNYYYYYRSLGTNHFKDVSNIKKMNSFIKDNFFLPAEIYPPYEKFEFFSSVLRIGQTNIFIWLHYDIPDNFLIQIKGRKKILLIPPKFIKYFNIINSSSSYNLFHILIKKNKLSKKEKIIKKILQKFALVADIYEGDVLFIPSLWLHYVYNMPAHTYLKKRYKKYHQYLYTVTEKLQGSFFSKEYKKEYDKKKNLSSYNFYKNSKFKIIGRNKTKKKKNTYVVTKKFKRKHESKIRLRYLANNIFLYTNKSDNLNCSEHLSYVPKDADKNELITHYSHLENYEEYLKKNFHIFIDSNCVQSCNRTSNNEKKGKKFLSTRNDNKKMAYNKKIEEKDNSEHLKHADNTATSKVIEEKGSDSSEDFYLNAKLNISVNYFFRKRKEICLFNKKDLYGNQDIHVVNQIFKKIQKEIKPLISVPAKYKNFYLQKIQGFLYSYLDEEYI
ncbi:JmjC domain-containing protein 2 [Plasmodium brasilianum]|uniref:JmjC domain containing protein, putative n=2 Tax=Plasmodium (Plasmodium) TaxID=418103 RepID=A0A1A8WYY1_PLAMA|nr:JmjC domain containing protein, putative [Plasmodium malariae]KAI4837462.1 JmjC domain-containing protein 2 [Plasmodium brasilianum]SBS96619.1 JmjC domain containing protein, putative [Plasmodium malariae]SCO93347.1 JmjC domain containing protein, putative [Plasmodium malariae]